MSRKIISGGYAHLQVDHRHFTIKDDKLPTPVEGWRLRLSMWEQAQWEAGTLRITACGCLIEMPHFPEQKYPVTCLECMGAE